MYKVKETPQINESFAVKKRFEWMLDEEVKAIPKGPSKVTVGGRVLKSDIVSKNKRHYAETEIMKATNTLIGKPINVNHSKRIIGNVERADFNNGILEFYGIVTNEGYAQRIKANDPNFKGWSVQADYFFNECGKCHKKFSDLDEFKKHMKEVEFVQNFNWEPRGIVFNGLALVESPEEPGYADTTLELLETKGALRLLETVAQDKEEREIMAYKVKEKEEPPKTVTETKTPQVKPEAKTEPPKTSEVKPPTLKEIKPSQKLTLKMLEAAPKLSLGEPFADYTDFADCVSKNSDKGNPEAYCGSIKHQVEGETYFKTQMIECINKVNEDIGKLQENIATQANILPSWIQEQFEPLKKQLTEQHQKLIDCINALPKDDLSWKEAIAQLPKDDLSWKETFANLPKDDLSWKALIIAHETKDTERDKKLTDAILEHKKEDEIKLKEKDQKIADLDNKLKESDKKLAETTTLATNTSQKLKPDYKGKDRSITNESKSVSDKLPYQNK